MLKYSRPPCPLLRRTRGLPKAARNISTEKTIRQQKEAKGRNRQLKERLPTVRTKKAALCKAAVKLYSERESNPHGHCWPQDFKSGVSTYSTIRATDTRHKSIYFISNMQINMHLQRQLANAKQTLFACSTNCSLRRRIMRAYASLRPTLPDSFSATPTADSRGGA